MKALHILVALHIVISIFLVHAEEMGKNMLLFIWGTADGRCAIS
jgi:hypothetical protein